MLSSHILDEVEKTCDQVAIVDRGEIVAIGLARRSCSGGGQPRVLIGVDGADEALELLAERRRSARDVERPRTASSRRR